MLKIILGFLITTASLPANAKTIYENFPWLVQVSSIYLDEEDGKEYTVTGRGFIISFEERLFVATASHVSQGNVKDSTKIEVFDAATSQMKSLKIAGRKSANLFDTEVLALDLTPEEKVSLSVLATAQSTLHSTAESTPHSFSPGILAVDAAVIDKHIPVTTDPRRSLYANESLLPLSLTRFIPSEETNAQSPLNAFKGIMFEHLMEVVASEETPQFMRYRLYHGITPGTLESAAMSQILPGMSGSPVIWVEQDSLRVFVEGIVSAKARYLQQSYIASANIVSSILNSFTESLDDPVAWHYRSGLTYRTGEVTGMPFEEVYFSKQGDAANRVSSGSASRSDGGNASRSDGGNASRSDGGNGSRSDGGKSLEDLTNPSLGAGIGMHIGGKDQQVVAMMFQTHFGDFLAYADMNALQTAYVKHEYEEQWQRRIKVGYLPAQGNLAGIAMELLAEQFDWEDGIDVNFEQVAPLTEINSGQGKIQISLFNGEKIGVQKLITGFDVDMDLGFDRFRFRVAASGALSQAGEKSDGTFHPLVKLKADSGNVYDFELASLLFHDLSKFNILYEHQVRSGARVDRLQPYREFLLHRDGKQYRVSF